MDPHLLHFQILEKLGEGGMGEVFKAWDTRLKRFAAIKFMSQPSSSDPVLRKRFLQEARAVSALDHPNICTVYEVGETGQGRVFMAMAFYPGQSLAGRLEQGPLPVPEAMDIALQVAQGLAKAHSAGVVHRDIKPGNVMLTNDGRVKILDFGLAKHLGDAPHTRPGTTIGTIGYMSPEQARGDNVDHLTDLWSLGVVLYQMLTGLLPFRGSSDYSVMKAIVEQDAPPVGALRAGIPPGLETVVARLLRKDPIERFQTAPDFIAALRTTGGSTDAAPVHPLATPLGPGPAIPRIGPSIAVLPFANLSPDPENEYFADGLTEELIVALSQVAGLHVVSRTSVFEFRGKAQSIRAIADQLKVENVLEGSVRRSGSRIRVAAQLVNAGTGFQIWSERFDREMTDIFDIQDEIAGMIVEKLRVRLTAIAPGPLVKHHTEHLEAYQLYLRGRYFWNKRTIEGFQRAIECFEGAVAAHPGYPNTYAGLSDYYSAMAGWGLAPAQDCWTLAKENALKAMALDPTLADAHASLGTVLFMSDWDWAGAEREFKRAIELNPGYPDGHLLYSLMLVRLGRFEEAMAAMNRALDLDPLSVALQAQKAGVCHYLRRYDRSLEICRLGLDLIPDDVELNVIVGLNLEQKGQFHEAAEQFRKTSVLAGNHPIILGPLASNLAQAGDREGALRIVAELDEISKTTYVAPITYAMAHLGLGDHDRFFEWLEKSAEVHDDIVTYVAVGPIYDPVRNDPRFAAFLRRFGLDHVGTGDARTRTMVGMGF